MGRRARTVCRSGYMAIVTMTELDGLSTCATPCSPHAHANRRGIRMEIGGSRAGARLFRPPRPNRAAVFF